MSPRASTASPGPKPLADRGSDRERLGDLGHAGRVAPGPVVVTAAMCRCIGSARPPRRAPGLAPHLGAPRPPRPRGPNPGAAGPQGPQARRRPASRRWSSSSSRCPDLSADTGGRKVADPRRPGAGDRRAGWCERAGRAGRRRACGRPASTRAAFTPALRDQWLHDSWSRAPLAAAARSSSSATSAACTKRHGVRRLAELADVPGIRLGVIGDGPERDWLRARLPTPGSPAPAKPATSPSPCPRSTWWSTPASTRPAATRCARPPPAAYPWWRRAPAGPRRRAPPRDRPAPRPRATRRDLPPAVGRRPRRPPPRAAGPPRPRAGRARTWTDAVDELVDATTPRSRPAPAPRRACRAGRPSHRRHGISHTALPYRGRTRGYRSPRGNDDRPPGHGRAWDALDHRPQAADGGQRPRLHRLRARCTCTATSRPSPAMTRSTSTPSTCASVGEPHPAVRAACCGSSARCSSSRWSCTSPPRSRCGDARQRARPVKYAVKRNAQLLALLAHDALGRADDPAVPRLAPAELHDRQDQPRRRRRPTTPTT